MVADNLITIVALLTTLFFAAAVAKWLKERRMRIEAASNASSHVESQQSADLILGDMTSGLAGQFPVGELRISQIQQELREAGFYHRDALLEYQAIRTALVLLALIVGGVLTALANRDRIPTYAFLTLLGAGTGASLPRYYVNTRARMRARQIERGLPITLDLVILGLSAGQTIFSALTSVCERVQAPFPILAQELKIVREQAEISNLSLALQHFADRTNVPDVRNLAMVLVQSDRLGTDVSGGLSEFSNSLRTNLRHRAEAQVNRSNFWMLIPTIGCLWIAAAMMLVLPIYYDSVEKRGEPRKLLTNESQRLFEMQKSKMESAREQ